jgi:riboflavin-specific deaminase-like protein
VSEDETAWAVALALAARASRGAPVDRLSAFDRSGAEAIATAATAWILVDPTAPRLWRPAAAALDPSAAAMLDLYLPLCVGAHAADLVVAHLAQTLDGQIATAPGASQFISGREDVEHAHRMRALLDAVIVGARTIECDDPRLTTRLVPGEHAVRVVIDPRRRLPSGHAVFRDGAAPTLLVCGAEHAHPERHGLAEIVAIEPAAGGLLPIPAVRAALARRGLRRLFVEGGGVTVSRFLEAGALDRLQVAVAPKILGAGRPAFSLPAIERLEDAIPLAWRPIALGNDVLFDCDLRHPGSG